MEEVIVEKTIVIEVEKSTQSLSACQLLPSHTQS